MDLVSPSSTLCAKTGVRDSLGRMRRADERIRQARGTPRHDRYRLETDMQATSATRKQPRP
jgi:hypothetical protein